MTNPAKYVHMRWFIFWANGTAVASFKLRAHAKAFLALDEMVAHISSVEIWDDTKLKYVDLKEFRQ